MVVIPESDSCQQKLVQGSDTYACEFDQFGPASLCPPLSLHATL